MAKVIQKLYLLLWKNFLLRIRHPIVAFFEVAIPIVLFLLMAYCRSTIVNFGRNYVNETTYYYPQMNNRFPLSDTKLFFAPQTKFTKELMENVRLDLSVLSTDFKGFNSEEDLLASNISEAKYNIMAVIFKGQESDEAPKYLNYVIRPREENNLWYTDELFADTFLGHRGSGAQRYIDSGFIALKLSIDKCYIKLVTNNDVPKIMFQEFPYPPHVEDSLLFDVFLYAFPLCTAFGFLTLCLSVIKRVVEEKISGIKELVKILGLQSWMHWFGWFMHAFIPNFIAVTSIVFFMKVNIFGGFSSPIEYCSWSVLFVFFLLYSISGIAFGFILSTFFSKPNIALICGILIWLVPYFILKQILSKYIFLNWYIKMIMCLLPNVAMEFGFRNIAIYESREIGVQWYNLMNSGSESREDVTMLNVFCMFIVDIVLYMLMTFYIDNVNPGPYGLAKPYFYPLSVLKKFVSFFKNETRVEDDLKPIKEEVAENIEPAEFLKPGIQIRNLRKNYGTKNAVCGLSIDIYEDQITALLGHNGAGKTTTLSILTGMIQATSGEVIIDNKVVIGNKLGKREFDKLRSSLGLCPQQNLHFTELTVLEHLMFFAMLRGSSCKKAKIESNELLKRLNLHNKKDCIPNSLSGGMKRKLSLGMTLIGNSKILILDEPTSGLDPEARREIWDMLLSFRGSRTIIISTHFMEEADVLGDRIAIMNHGKLECYGTSMFLKNIYGTGYHLTTTVDSEIEDGTLENNETFMRIEEVIKHYVPPASIKQKRGNCCTFLLPIENKADYAKLLEELENNKKKLNISNINITYTTLEEVFLRVENMASKNGIDNGSDCGSDNFVSYSGDYKKKGFELIWQQFLILLKTKFLVLKKMKKATFLQILFLTILTAKTVYFSSSTSKQNPTIKQNILSLDLSIYDKSFVYFNRVPENLRNFTSNYENVVKEQKGIPIQVNNVSVALVEKGLDNIFAYKKHCIVAAKFNNNKINAMYSSEAIHAIPISLNLITNAFLQLHKGSEYSISVKLNPLPISANVEITEVMSKFEVLLLWIFLFPLGLLFAICGFLLFPQLENTSNSKQLQIMCGIRPIFYWLTTYLFDLIFYTLIVLLQLCCIWIIHLASDDQIPFIGKYEIDAIFAIMMVYGISGIAYSYMFSYCKTAASAFAAFIISSLIIGVSLSVVVFVFLNSGIPYYIDLGTTLKYVFSFLPQFGVTFTSYSFANKAVQNWNWKAMNKEDRYRFCRFEPTNPCCVDSNSTRCSNFQSYFYSEDFGIMNELLIMIISTSVYLVILNLIEMQCLRRLYDRIMHFIACYLYPDKSVLDVDEEVKHEQERVHSTLKREKSIKVNDVLDSARHASDVLLVDNLQKTFGRKKVVRGISFGVGKRSCFGLLGVNGAGKTTTFRMLTGSESCTDGDARIYDNNFFGINDPEYLQRVGYCPQFDAINELLTGRALLELFAKLRGLSEKESNNEVEYWIKTLGLTEWADQPCGEYSGGNKRKLSMAIALIGNQPITMLDEPTSGVDPVSRRKLWNVITEIQMDQSRSTNPIILTSHSMEECEVLCNKLAIMKDGQLECIGTLPQLKKKYGQGFTVQLKLKPMINILIQNDDDRQHLLESNSNEDKLQKLKKYFTKKYSCVLKDEHSGLLHYHINDRTITWSRLFKEIEELKNMHPIIEDYNISETTLEEIFLTIAKNGKENDKGL